MVVVASLVGTAFAIVLGAIGWGWSRNTLLETEQERIDREFHRLVRDF
ncbi:MAG TPA: hypothetical protein VLG28_06965 [Acidimicrobiia bacterium]|jgi:hypothetical protein|nr:hypothetical protein [Acidimicrobiia bacterium]